MVFATLLFKVNNSWENLILRCFSYRMQNHEHCIRSIATQHRPTDISHTNSSHSNLSVVTRKYHQSYDPRCLLTHSSSRLSRHSTVFSSSDNGADSTSDNTTPFCESRFYSCMYTQKLT